ncbi:hypothetical protein R80B4_01905 [Fibrobacteres bacterium R8-0-B4]
MGMGTAGLALSVLITALLAAVVANHASAVAAPSPYPYPPRGAVIFPFPPPPPTNNDLYFTDNTRLTTKFSGALYSEKHLNFSHNLYQLRIHFFSKLLSTGLYTLERAGALAPYGLIQTTVWGRNYNHFIRREDNSVR